MGRNKFSDTRQCNDQLDDSGDEFNDTDLPEKIGKNLRQIYDDVLSEPVPDDFLNLLAQADNAKK